MKHLTLLLLAISLSFTMACSKKSDGGVVVTPPPTTDPNQPGTNPDGSLNWPYYQGGHYYSNQPAGDITVSNNSQYKKFFKTAFDYAYYGGNYSYDEYDYDYNYTCDANIFFWLTGGDFIDCYTQQDQFNDYVEWLASEGTVVQLTGISGYQVHIRVHLGSYIEWNWGSPSILMDEHVRTLDMTATASRNAQGQLILDAYPLEMVSVQGDDSRYNIYFEGTKFGTIRLR